MLIRRHVPHVQLETIRLLEELHIHPPSCSDNTNCDVFKDPGSVQCSHYLPRCCARHNYRSFCRSRISLTWIILHSLYISASLLTFFPAECQLDTSMSLKSKIHVQIYNNHNYYYDYYNHNNIIIIIITIIIIIIMKWYNRLSFSWCVEDLLKMSRHKHERPATVSSEHHTGVWQHQVCDSIRWARWWIHDWFIKRTITFQERKLTFG